MAASVPRRVQILVWAGLAGAAAGLVVAWLWRQGAAMGVACRARGFCLTPDNVLALIFGPPVAGLAAGAAFAVARARLAGANAVAGAVVTALLTLVLCGVIEYATPVTTGLVRLPPTWVPVALASVFTVVAWAAAARTRRGWLLMLTLLAVPAAAVLVAMLVRGPLQGRENRAVITAARIPLLGVDLPGYQIAVASVLTGDPAQYHPGVPAGEPPHLYITMVPRGATLGQTMAADLPTLSVDISRATSRPWPPCLTDGNGPCRKQRPGLWARERPVGHHSDLYLRHGTLLIRLDGHHIPVSTLIRAAGTLHPEPADIYAHATTP